MKKSPVGKEINYSGLTNPIPHTELKQFIEQQDAGRSLRVLSTVMMVMGFIGLFGGAAGMVVGAISSGANGVIGGLLYVVMGIAVVIGSRMLERMYVASARVSRFAHDNGWHYARAIHNPTHQGIIFQQGHSRVANDVVYLTGDAAAVSFEAGRYQYTTGSGKHQRTYHWIYSCVEMDRHLPHMILDAKANNASLFGKSLGTNLPMSLHKGQVLSLEGDFDKYFTLYAPEDYKRDALYLFTPDLMALLIDNARSFDAEVVDNKLYIYAQQSGGNRVAMTNPQFVYQLLSIIHVIGMKLHRQSDYYADETVANRSNDVVAAGGRRLKQGVSWLVIIIAVLFIGFHVTSIIIGIAGGK